MQAYVTEECSLVDACVLFAYNTSPVIMLGLLQWCGFDVKQRAGKTQASIKRTKAKKVHPWLVQADSGRSCTALHKTN